MENILVNWPKRLNRHSSLILSIFQSAHLWRIRVLIYTFCVCVQSTTNTTNNDLMDRAGLLEQKDEHYRDMQGDYSIFWIWRSSNIIQYNVTRISFTNIFPYKVIYSINLNISEQNTIIPYIRNPQVDEIAKRRELLMW